MLSAEEKLSDTISLVTNKATLADLGDLELVVNLAYRGGKATVAWKNEHHLVQGPRITLAELKTYIESADSCILTLREKDSQKLVGCVQIERKTQEAHIGMLTVHPECQNLGLGKMLLLKAGDYAKNDFKCTIAKMCVLGGRVELLNWYKKMGYEETGESMPFFGPESGLTPLIENPHFIVVQKPLH